MDGWERGGGDGGEGEWEAGGIIIIINFSQGGLNPPLGLFGLAMSPRSAGHRLKHG